MNTGDGTVTGFNQNTQEDRSGSWINGALNQNNSNYAEGDYVPQRVQLSGLNPGAHQIYFTYDRTKNGKFAYDFVDHLSIDEPGATHLLGRRRTEPADAVRHLGHRQDHAGRCRPAPTASRTSSGTATSPPSSTTTREAPPATSTARRTTSRWAT